jgi:ABC-type lipoprotein export system ATPase subunit
MRSLVKEKHITVILCTHDMTIAGTCDRVVYILDGKIEKIAQPQ